jgi:TolB-like protein
MRHASRCFLLAAVLAGLGSHARATDDGRPAVAVMEFASKGGVTQEQMDALGELLASDIRKLKTFRVIGKADIQAVLQYEEKKALTGCGDDSCIAEIGGALGAQFVTVGNVSKFGDTYLLNLRVIDVKKVSVLQSVSEKVEGGEAALLDATSAAVREIFVPLAEELAAGGAPAASGSGPKDAAPAAVAEAPAKPMSTATLVGHVTFWSGVGLCALGGVGLGLSMNAASDYEKGDLGAKDTSKTWAGVMWAGFGLGGALLITGVVMWLLPEQTQEAGVTAAAAPTADGDGFTLTLGGRF